jgi:hypothetical protein
MGMHQMVLTQVWCRDKIIASGKLRVEGVLEGNDLEIYGNVIVIGSL